VKYFFLFLLISNLFGCKSLSSSKEVIREYTLLGHEFEEILISDKISDFINQITFKIVGNITGKAVIVLYHPPFDRRNRGAKIRINIEGIINETIKDEWYDKECLIHFIPEDSSVKGEIKISYKVF
jgi:hypothetical protein